MNTIMRRLRYILSLAVLTNAVDLSSHAQDRVGDFTLLDQLGVNHNMQWYDDQKTIAFLVQANDSATTAAALPRYIELQKNYAAQGIQFFMINPMGRQNRDEVNAIIAAHSNAIPVLMDDSQQISQALGINSTGEALLFDPQAFQVIYRGLVDDAFEQAISAVLNGKEIVTSGVAQLAADIEYQNHGLLSYENDIAPILAENCATCHREGGIAPFALNNHAMVQGWAPMIREVLMTRRMPPGQIDRHVHQFSNDRNLEIEQIQKLISWIDAGAVKEGNHDPLTALTWSKSKWSVPYGEPDVIVKVPSQEIPATGILDYRYLTVPIEGMEGDRWVRASEFVPGESTVVHHSTARVVSGGTSAGERSRNPDVALISRYVPGQAPRLEGENTGGLLKKDSSLYITMHYTTSGKETVDESEYGIWFYPEGVVPEERLVSTMVGRWSYNWEDIPANVKNFEMVAQQTINEDVNVLGYHPHMHFRGKDLRMYADYPDGTREELINVAYYSYLWQLTYDLEQPKFMPAGTVITSIGHFDNSAQNPFNPDPNVTIPWGEQSWDEMFFGEMVYKLAN